MLLYVCRAVRQTAPKAPDLEIADSGFFALDALPPAATDATRRRLGELARGVPFDPYW